MYVYVLRTPYIDIRQRAEANVSIRQQLRRLLEEVPIQAGNLAAYPHGAEGRFPPYVPRDSMSMSDQRGISVERAAWELTKAVSGGCYE